VLVAAAVLYLFRDKLNPAQTQAPSQTPAAAQSPIATPSAAQGSPSSPSDTANPASTETQAPAKAAKNSQKGAIKPIKPSETRAIETTQTSPPPKAAEPPPAQHGKCDLEPSQYSGQIDQAARNLGRGKYADAVRQFSAVLACDPGNGRAKEGLERARMAARESE
jgi:anthranilate/para-aminobenzoate synthase component I